MKFESRVQALRVDAEQNHQRLDFAKVSPFFVSHRVVKRIPYVLLNRFNRVASGNF